VHTAHRAGADHPRTPETTPLSEALAPQAGIQSLSAVHRSTTIHAASGYAHATPRCSARQTASSWHSTHGTVHTETRTQRRAAATSTQIHGVTADLPATP
jgi:hypothetical protein